MGKRMERNQPEPEQIDDTVQMPQAPQPEYIIVRRPGRSAVALLTGLLLGASGYATGDHYDVPQKVVRYFNPGGNSFTSPTPPAPQKIESTPKESASSTPSPAATASPTPEANTPSLSPDLLKFSTTQQEQIYTRTKDFIMSELSKAKGNNPDHTAGQVLTGTGEDASHDTLAFSYSSDGGTALLGIEQKVDASSGTEITYRLEKDQATYKIVTFTPAILEGNPDIKPSTATYMLTAKDARLRQVDILTDSQQIQMRPANLEGYTTVKTAKTPNDGEPTQLVAMTNANQAAELLLATLPGVE